MVLFRDGWGMFRFRMRGWMGIVLRGCLFDIRASDAELLA